MLTEEELKAAADKAAADAVLIDAADEEPKVTDWQADAIKWKKFSRQHEEEAKSLRPAAARLAEIEAQNLSDSEKATARAEAAEKLAASNAAESAVLRAAVKFKLSEDDLDLLGTHGTPEEIEARAEKLSVRLSAADSAKRKLPDMGGGDRGLDVGTSKQITSKADLDSMTPDEINSARREGRLTSIL